jgi:hypothetical protein
MFSYNVAGHQFTTALDMSFWARTVTENHVSVRQHVTYIRTVIQKQ